MVREGDVGRLISFWATLVNCVFPFVFAPELIIFTVSATHDLAHNPC